MKSFSAFVLGGVASGSGKTLVSLGLMAALKRRGMNVQPFKCGPDFIDPSLHKMVTGKVSSNLDLRMCGKQFCKETFARRSASADIGLVEGVMGLFDGGEASSAALAVELGLPVVLVVDVRSAAQSVAAVLKGFECFSESVTVSGVIFNRVGSARHRELIELAVRENCDAEIIGFLPRDEQFEMPERHLGLHMGDEDPLPGGQLDRLVAVIEDNLDLDRLVEVCRVDRPPMTAAKHGAPVAEEERIRLGVAHDEAFCFYYEDNLDLFRQHGFEPVFFSPLHDRALPVELDALYFGGGYPELYAAELSDNGGFLESVHDFADKQGVIYGECGGFMYLCDSLVDLDGKEHRMTGIFPARTRMGKRLSRLGYREVALLADSPLGACGDRLYGHEFHYSAVETMAEGVATAYRLNNGKGEGYRIGNCLASYVHLHFGRNQETLNCLGQFVRENKSRFG